MRDNLRLDIEIDYNIVIKAFRSDYKEHNSSTVGCKYRTPKIGEHPNSWRLLAQILKGKEALSIVDQYSDVIQKPLDKRCFFYLSCIFIPTVL